MSANLPPIDSYDTAHAISLLQELAKWKPSPELVKEDNFNEALEAVHQAIRETKKYLKHRREGGDRDGAIENHLSDLWMAAAPKIQPYDGQLAGLCYVKGDGWADEATWDAPENRDLPIRIDQMLERVRKLGETSPPKDVPSWFPIAGVIFTFISVASLLYLLVGPQDLSSGRHIIFDVFVAICLAASASFLGGTARAHGQLPLPSWWGGESLIDPVCNRRRDRGFRHRAGHPAQCLSLGMALVSVRRSHISPGPLVSPTGGLLFSMPF